MSKYEELLCICSKCGALHEDVVNVESPPRHMVEIQPGVWRISPSMSADGKRRAFVQWCDDCLSKHNPTFAEQYKHWRRKLVLHADGHMGTV